MIIYDNVPAMQTAFNVNQTNNALQNSLTRLSTGLRINKAADDAAGLAITSTMNNTIAGMSQASINVQNGINMLQTADSAAGQLTSILNRLQTLANEAANNTLTSGNRTQIKQEVGQLITDINRIASSTNFNGVYLLNGTLSASGKMQIQVGATKGDTFQVQISKLNASSLGIGAISVSSVTGANNAIGTIQTAVDSLATARANLGAYQNGLQYLSNNLQTSVQNLTASQSSIADTDVATEMANFTKLQILEQSGTAMLTQANALPQAALKLIG